MRQLVAAIVAVAVAFGASAMAQVPPGPPPGGKEGEIVQINGTLAKIEERALTIKTTVEGEAKEVVVTCTRGTRFFTTVPTPEMEEAAKKYEKEPARSYRARVKLEDLKVGQTVRVYHHIDDNVAVVVTIVPAPVPAKEAPKKE